MLSQYKFREGTLNDLAQVKQLGLLCFGTFFNQLSAEAKTNLEKSLQDENRIRHLLSHAKSFVCEYQNQIIGMAYLVPSGTAHDVFENNWAVIRMVCVSPMHQGKNIAKQLTQQCIDYAKQSDEKTIALHTSEMMNAARHIYEGFGFKILKEIEARFGKRYWLYLLKV